MPKKASSNKRVRQYEHVKQSAKKRGAPPRSGPHIAAATLQRALAGKH
jgi:hypothetical protein